ncbi:hypothetical protein B566_EDAN000682 [Ephemera danica]|nr:hypothetical protein B566_EDAN000682 [Ephemera danica]
MKYIGIRFEGQARNETVMMGMINNTCFVPLSWHPEKEGVLGFSTSEGRVGICNVSNLGKEPVVFRQFHRSTVYRVAWGPPTYAKTDEPPTKSDFCLYASDETVSVCYDPSNPEEE